MLLGHIWKQSAAKKGKGGTFPREITHQMPQQFLATQISGTVRGKG